MLAIELIRANKRILVVCPDHQAADALVGTIARAMKAVGLMYKTWVSRYEMALAQQVEGIGIQELGFEAQMHSSMPSLAQIRPRFGANTIDSAN